jgi:hypothetical protein
VASLPTGATIYQCIVKVVLSQVLISIFSIITGFLYSVAVYTMYEMYVEVPEVAPDYENIGFFEAWHLVLKGMQHKHGEYYVMLLPKLGIAWFLGAFQGVFTVQFPCRMLYLFTSVFREHKWYEILPWIELPVMCFFGCSLITAQTGWQRMSILYFVKWLFWRWSARTVDTWLLWEFVGISIFSSLGANKTFQAVQKSLQMFFKSFQNCKDAIDFLGSDPIVLSDDGTNVIFDQDTSHPLRQLHYNRENVNEW